MSNDDDIVLISAIEHYSYCPRQCMLIHGEQVFDENVFTLRGSAAHERVDEPDVGTEEGVRVERSLPIWSERLGLQGRADVVEFGADGTVCPVEYKLGARSSGVVNRLHPKPDDLQLCAQAMCLEEMLGVEIACGAIYHITSRRRREVMCTSDLRTEVERAVTAIREMLRSEVTPPPVNDARCPNCSLVDACVPEVLAEARLEWHVRDLYRVDPT